MNDQTVLNALLRKDLTAFIHKSFLTVSPGERFYPNPHIEAIAYHLSLCSVGRIKRLLITMPPRSLKSLAVSVAFPAWLLGRNPTHKLICASYSQQLTVQHANNTRCIMQSEWYQECFPGTRLHPNKNTETEFKTTRQGYRLGTSVGGTLTGRGGNFIIMDDLHKADEAESDVKRESVINWYKNVLVSRLNNKQKDVMILVQQRLHENDLAGYLLENEDWVHLNLPAIAEEEQHIRVAKGRVKVRKPGQVLHKAREPLSVLNKIKKSIGSYAFAAQYQQRPAPLGGGILKWEWFKRYNKAPEQIEGDLVVQSWDTASKADEDNDWSVCTTWLCHGKYYFLLDVFRARLEFPALTHQIAAQANHWHADAVLIEAVGAGIPLIQELEQNSCINVIATKPKDDKVTRAMAESPVIEAGRVVVLKEAPWLADFQREIVQFPQGKHDDQVDSLTQFLYWARHRTYPAQQSEVMLLKGGPMPNLTPDDLFHLRLW